MKTSFLTFTVFDTMWVQVKSFHPANSFIPLQTQWKMENNWIGGQQEGVAYLRCKKRVKREYCMEVKPLAWSISKN